VPWHSCPMRSPRSEPGPQFLFGESRSLDIRNIPFRDQRCVRTVSEGIGRSDCNARARRGTAHQTLAISFHRI